VTSSPDLALTVLAVLGGLLAIALVFAVALLSTARRGRNRESREIVGALEELRDGRHRHRLDLDPRSPYAAIADSVNRLGQDLGVRTEGAAAAKEGFDALQEVARGYAVFNTDADGDLLGASAGALTMFGWEEDAILGRNASLLFEEGSWRELLPKLARKSLRERGVETRALLVRRDGTRFHARVHVRALRGAGEGPKGFLLVVQDITDQVRLESELRTAESRTRVVLEGLPIGAGLVQGGRLVVANAALRELLEVDEREAAGLPLIERIATEDVLVVEEALRTLEGASPGATYETFVRVRDASGRPRREVRFVAAARAHEERPAVVVLLRDETVERRLLAELRANEARLDGLLERLDDGLLLIADGDEGGRVRFANRALLDLLGLESADVLGAREGDVLRAMRGRGEIGAAAAALLAASPAGPVADAITWGVDEDRRAVLHAAPLGPQGRLLRIRDVTAAWRVERETASDSERVRRRHDGLESAHADLRARYEEMQARRDESERLNQELRRLDAMKSDLLANVSHELQTPLVSIRGYTEMIHKGRLGPVNEEQKKGLGLALTNIDRLIAMIDNLLAFARRDRQMGTTNPTVFPLAPAIDETLALLRDKIEARSLQVARRYDEPELTVKADRDQIVQVLLNLLSNAIKFNRDGGSIEILVRRGKPGFAMVHVRDTGIGIAQEDLEKVFERFYRAGEPQAEGTGIGLAIVRNILRLHGCTIQASSVPGEGTTFTFSLPVPDEPAAERPSSTPPLESAPPRSPRSSRLRIIRRS
jgi:PAS domain S-box-containing protein